MRYPIPREALEDRLFFGGTAGSGKTYNASTGVEFLLISDHRVVIPDPLGVWYGLAFDASGKKPSLFRQRGKLVIFGGPRGDLPLSEHAGALIGETVAGMKESCILDLSEIGTRAGERRFMLAFLTALYKHKAREPLHVVFDEADMWAPQQIRDRDGEAAKLYGMMETIVRRGRVKGYVPWLISQRPAVIAKDVLSQIDGLITFKLTSSQDRDAIGSWVEGQADRETWKQLRGELPALERGTGVIWLPARGVLKTAAFPEKTTFDSSRTPKRGERVQRAGSLKPLNLDKLKERLAVVEAEAKASDPKKLRAEIASLTAQRDKLQKQVENAAPAKAKPDKATEAAVKQLRAALEVAMKFIVQINAENFFKAGGDAIDKEAVNKAIAAATENITRQIEAHMQRRDKEIVALRGEASKVLTRLNKIADQDVTVSVDVKHNEPFTIAPKAAPVRPAPVVIADGTFTRPQTRVLQSLAMWRSIGHEEPSREMVAAVAGYSVSSGGFNNLLGGLNTAGAIAYPRPGSVTLLAEGIGVPSREEGADLLLGHLSNPQKKIIGALLGREALARDVLGATTGYSPSSGGFNNLLGSLRTLGIIDYPSKGLVAMSDWAEELLAGRAERLAA